ncbi:hypothetical protein RCL1_002186 [Eukaryota sp. TZLM3-RCL]
MAFAPHNNTVGGRDLLVHSRYNHTMNLNSARSTFSTQSKLPTKPISEKLARDINTYLGTKGDSYQEICETFRRVSTVSSRIDNKPPKSLNYRTHCRGKNKRKESYQERQHRLELEHLERRKATTHSATNKKKDPLNYSVYPSYVMRKLPRPYSVPPLSLDTSRSNKSWYDTSRSTIQTKPDYPGSRPSSCRLSQTFQSKTVDTFPLPSLANIESADDLYSRLEHCIIENRLYKDSQLQELEEWVEEHDNIDAIISQEAIQRIIKDYFDL